MKSTNGTTMKRGVLLLLAWALGAGCAGRDAASALPADAAAARVGELLYSENLIADPEVNARVRESISAVDGEGVPADSVLPELYTWLERWVENHPDRAERARLMPSQPPSAARTPAH
jgi:hypothetical protein